RESDSERETGSDQPVSNARPHAPLGPGYHAPIDLPLARPSCTASVAGSPLASVGAPHGTNLRVRLNPNASVDPRARASLNAFARGRPVASSLLIPVAAFAVTRRRESEMSRSLRRSLAVLLA